MRIKSEKIYCDICKAEIKNNDDRVNILPPSIKITYTQTVYETYEDVCQYCFGKIEELIEELKKEKS